MNETGFRGERRIKKFFEENSYEVEDLTKNSQFFYQGDFKVTNPISQKSRIYEVKTDSCIARTGNMFVEQWDGAKGGWFEYLPNDTWLLYYDFNNNIAYQMEMRELRNFIELEKGRLHRAQCSKDGKHHTSRGFLVPIADLLNQGLAQSIKI